MHGHPICSQQFKNYIKASAEETKTLNVNCFKSILLMIHKEKRATDFSSSLYEMCASGGKKMLGKIILHCQIPYDDKIERF